VAAKPAEDGSNGSDVVCVGACVATRYVIVRMEARKLEES
jgi:hypothetical protein